MNFLKILEAIPLVAPAVRAIADAFRPAPKPAQDVDARARQGTAAGAAAHRAGKKVSSR